MHRPHVLVLPIVFGLALGLAACASPPAPEDAAPPAAAPVAEASALPGMEAAPSDPSAASSATGMTATTGTTMTGSAGSGAAAAGGLLKVVKARGKLVCGVNDQLPGFGYVDSSGEHKGFDVDFCRAIAAAVLSDASAVDFRPLTAQQRFTALQTGEVDVLIRNTTWTLSRDTQNSLDFGPTTFYDGQGIMVRKAAGVEGLADLAGATVCVTSGTTTEKNLEDAMRTAGVKYTPVVQETPDGIMSTYDQGRCDAVTADRSALVSRLGTLTDPAANTILSVTLSKEPLGPAVLQGDAQWADVVDWVVYGLIAAEEQSVSSRNIDEALAGENPEVRRMLGVEDKLGEGLGLSNDFLVKAIRAVGNYAEIYDRNLGADSPLKLERGLNRLWNVDGGGGLLYSPPFR